MEYIKTGTDKVFNVILCDSISNTLYIIFNGYSFADVAPVFIDEKETIVIKHYEEDKLINSFEGFTTVTDMTLVDNNNVRITLKRYIQYQVPQL